MRKESNRRSRHIGFVLVPLCLAGLGCGASRQEAPPPESRQQLVGVKDALNALLGSMALQVAVLSQYKNLQETDFVSTMDDLDVDYLATLTGRGSPELDGFIRRISGEPRPYTAVSACLQRFGETYDAINREVKNGTKLDRQKMLALRTEAGILVDATSWIADHHRKVSPKENAASPAPAARGAAADDARSTEVKRAVEGFLKQVHASTLKLCDLDEISDCRSAARSAETADERTNLLRKARTLAQQKCSPDDVDACENLAELAQKGEGGPQDSATADRANGVVIDWLTKRCDGRESGGVKEQRPETCILLGQRWAEGNGVPADKAKAAEFYQRAIVVYEARCQAAEQCGPGTICRNGDVRSCEMIAKLASDGKVGAIDTVRARTYYRKACHLRSGAACRAVLKIDRGQNLGEAAPGAPSPSPAGGT